jgi:hypothetical protein
MERGLGPPSLYLMEMRNAIDSIYHLDRATPEECIV